MGQPGETPTEPGAPAALLALSGALPGRTLMIAMKEAHATLIAADGAAVALAELGLRPDVLIGDLDSVGPLRDELAEAGTTVVEEASQETNDFEKALVWLTESGYDRVTVVGIDGGMVDHTLNNFSILARHARHLALEIRSGAAVGRCVIDRLELPTADGERISLIPLPTARLTTVGLAWELADEVLAIGRREGASNRALGALVSVKVHEGVVLVVHYPTN